MEHERFIDSDFSELEEANSSPIHGYQDLPVLTLEEATETLTPLVPGVTDSVSKAKERCNRSSTVLTKDESAAIYLYSMPILFFSRLNKALRAKKRHALKPWLPFLKLFINALEKLPSTRQIVWRGVSGNVGKIFADGDVHIWWSVNSCSMDLSVVKIYLGETGTIFAIDAIQAKNISKFSVFSTEQELVLMPGTRVRAKSSSIDLVDRFFIIHLEEENELR
jgi:hypothetical protein